MYLVQDFQLRIWDQNCNYEFAKIGKNCSLLPFSYVGMDGRSIIDKLSQ